MTSQTFLKKHPKQDTTTPSLTKKNVEDTSKQQIQLLMDYYKKARARMLRLCETWR